MKKVEILLKDVEYNLIGLSGREMSLLETALLAQRNKEEKDSDTNCYLEELINKIADATSKVDKL